MSDPIETRGSVENRLITPAFTDARGDIYDLLEEKVGHVGLITFVKGATRAKHYHKESIQYSYVLSGTIKLTTSAVDGSEAQEFTLEKGAFTKIPPHTVHTYEALTDAEILDMTTLSRTDNGYEEDTVRVG